ncbi:MAG: SHOCT domain-containing protein [Sphingobacteriales bacterium]|nr:SHOCT domain-containing protein [Sphingobacteriales bacterium]
MDKLQKIKELKQLFDDGVITSSEYENLKNETLNNEDNSISVATINNKTGTLTISWVGRSYLFDFKLDLYLNKESLSSFYFKKSFSTTIPITNEKIQIQLGVPLSNIKTNFNITKFDLDLQKNQDYNMLITFNNGKYSYDLKNIN